MEMHAYNRLRAQELWDNPEPSLGLGHIKAAHELASAMNNFTMLLFLGGLVLLIVICYEMEAWRRLIWRIVEDAGVSESVEWRDLVRSLVPKWVGR